MMRLWLSILLLSCLTCLSATTSGIQSGTATTAADGTFTNVFATPFAGTPAVVLTPIAAPTVKTNTVVSVTTSQFAGNLGASGVQVFWIAQGPVSATGGIKVSQLPFTNASPSAALLIVDQPYPGRGTNDTFTTTVGDIFRQYGFWAFDTNTLTLHPTIDPNGSQVLATNFLGAQVLAALGAFQIRSTLSATLTPGTNDLNPFQVGYILATSDVNTTNPVPRIVRLSAGSGSGSILFIENYTNLAVTTTAFTMNSGPLWDGSGDLTLPNGPWTPTHAGETMLLQNDGLGWREVTRFFGADGGQGAGLNTASNTIPVNWANQYFTNSPISVDPISHQINIAVDSSHPVQISDQADNGILVLGGFLPNVGFQISGVGPSVQYNGSQFNMFMPNGKVFEIIDGTGNTNLLVNSPGGAGNGWNNSPTSFLAADGNYHPVTSGPTINATDTYLPYRLNGTTLANSPFSFTTSVTAPSVIFKATNQFTGSPWDAFEISLQQPSANVDSFVKLHTPVLTGVNWGEAYFEARTNFARVHITANGTGFSSTDTIDILSSGSGGSFDMFKGSNSTNGVHLFPSETANAIGYAAPFRFQTFFSQTNTSIPTFAVINSNVIALAVSSGGAITTGDPGGGPQPWQLGGQTIISLVTNLVVNVNGVKYAIVATPIP